MSKSLTAIKPLYKQEVHHFDDLYSWSKAHESQVIRTAFGNEESSFVSEIKETSTLFPAISQTFSNLFRIESVFIYEKMIVLGFFNLKLPKWDTFEAINEESFVRLLTCSLIFQYNQLELTIFEIFFVKRASCKSYCAIWFYIAHYKIILRVMISFCAI